MGMCEIMTDENNKKQEIPLYRNPKILASVIIAIAMIIVAIIGVLDPPPPPPTTAPSTTIPAPTTEPPSSVEVTITSPNEGDKVLNIITVIGTISRIPEGKHLWLFTRPNYTSFWWPESVEIKPNQGNWKGTATLSGDVTKDNGRKYEIIAAFVNEKDNDFLRDYVKNHSYDHNWVHIQPPSSAEKIATVTVTLNEK